MTTRMETDVLVAGGGGAGFRAAIARKSCSFLPVSWSR